MFTASLRTVRKNSAEWSAILNPVVDEFNRRQAIDKIADVFSISHTEAGELVDRTPVILLESLTEESAASLKRYFAEAHVELLISNDTSLRKRCYRTVWPERPSLDFLNKKAESSAEGPGRENASLDSRKPSALSAVPQAGVAAQPMLRTETIAAPLPAYDASRTSKVVGSTPSLAVPAAHEKRDLLIDELKDRLLSVQHEADELKRVNEKLRRDLEEAERSKAEKMISDMLADSRPSFDAISLEHERDRTVLEEKIERVSTERETLSTELAALREALKKAQSDRERLSLERGRLSQERDELLKSLTQQRQELETLKSSVSTQRKMEQDYQQVRLRCERLVAEQEENQQRLLVLEEAKRTFELQAIQLSDEAARLRQEYEAAAKRVRELEGFAVENRKLQDEMRQAQDRLREMSLNREQQEAIAKRLRLQSELVEKETRLKELVKKQEVLEREIVERGQSVQQVLSDQEEIEREIVQAKQSQKYLSEQIKSREKPRLRLRGPMSAERPSEGPTEV